MAIIPRYYENLQVLHVNTMPDRCYYIPASFRMEDPVEKREESDRIQMLNGTWKFRYYRSIYELTEPFFEEDADTTCYESISVPGVWQTSGCDTHQYTNIRYPFPVDPPYVPQENPCGAYLREFDYRKDAAAPEAFLEFEGVDSCFYVWLNGSFVGYSQVSHALHEFNVSPYIKEGRNRLAVLVLKWCDGSYFEDQDKFRMSGIFRDVYLMKRPQKCIFDYTVRTELSGTRAFVDVTVDYFGAPVPVKASLYDAENAPIAEAEALSTLSLAVDAPKLWNSEQPYLYTLVLETEHEIIVEYVGFREIRIKDNAVYLNGAPIKIRGVNRHDSHPVTGFTLDLAHMKRDLELMKQYNFNAVRTSHYPPQPMLCQMCDRYGFYVMGEADLEIHGARELYIAEDSEAEHDRRWNELITDDPQYNEAVLDRVKKLVIRDRNRPCILIWSMGNESAYGCTIENALAWTKAYDPGRLTHYESAFYKNRSRKKYDYSKLDLYSRMYASLEDIEHYVNAKPDKPFLLCEYCHSMGNGAGDYEDYFEKIERYDCVLGGFVWEWCDHAIEKGKDEAGKTIWYYGGDHGEFPHDGNFCTDGLVYPDRTPHTGLMEVKNVNRPARIIFYDQKTGEAVIRNELNFTDLREYVTIRYEVSVDGELTGSGTIPADCGLTHPEADPRSAASVELPPVAPRSTGNLVIPVCVSEEGRAFLKVIYLLKTADVFRPSGHVLGFDELPLKTADPVYGPVRARMAEEKERSRACSAVRVTETDSAVLAEGDGFSYRYSKLYGTFEQLTVDGVPFFTKPMEVNIWRAPTDNDRFIREQWQRAMFDRAHSRAYSTEVVAEEDHIEIRTVMGMTAVSVQRIMTIFAVWRIDPSGQISVTMDVVRAPEFPELPRFGIRMFLPEAFGLVTYFGLGPEESYIDKCRASSHGRYRAQVRDLHEDYIRPQENGSHADCEYVSVEDGRGCVMYAYSKNRFSMNASVYTQEALTETLHNFELIPSGSTVLNLDHRQNGIGSASCGPRLLEKYRFDEESFTFTMTLKPEIR